MQIRVYYEDTDAGGIVYHTNYIKYCERARSEVFFARGMIPVVGSDSGFVVRRMAVEFLATAKLGDRLEVRSRIVECKRTALTLCQEIYKEEKKIFSMEVLLVYTQGGKPTRIPEVFGAVFAQMG